MLVQFFLFLPFFFPVMGSALNLKCVLRSPKTVYCVSRHPTATRRPAGRALAGPGRRDGGEGEADGSGESCDLAGYDSGQSEALEKDKILTGKRSVVFKQARLYRFRREGEREKGRGHGKKARMNARTYEGKGKKRDNESEREGKEGCRE